MNARTPSRRCLFPLNDLDAFMPARFIERGRRYFDDGRVGRLEITTNLHNAGSEMLCLGHAKAQVQGAERTPYEVNFFWESSPHELIDINGWCTCPVGQFCKHVAALAFAVHHALSEDDPAQDDWERHLTQLHHTLHETALPADRMPFVAWVIIEKPVRQSMIPLVTRRSKQNPERLLKGKILRAQRHDEAATALDEALRAYQDPFSHEVPLDGLSPSLLSLLARAGRLWLNGDQSLTRHALRWSDEAIAPALQWRHADGRWHLSLNLPDHQAIWKSPQPWLLIDRERRVLHPLTLPLPCWQMETLLEQYWLLPDQADVEAFSTRWRSLFGDDFPVPPPQTTQKQAQTIQPVALLAPRRLTDVSPIYTLELKAWRYGQTEIPPDATLVLIEDGERLWQRDRQAENAILAAFDRWIGERDLPLRSVHEDGKRYWIYRGDFYIPYASLLAFHDLYSTHAEALKSMHVEIRWPEELPQVHAADGFEASLSRAAEDDALTLDLTLEVEGMRLPLAPMLAQLLQTLAPGEEPPPLMALELQPEGEPLPHLYRIPTAPLRPYLDLLYSLHARGALKDARKPIRLHPLESLMLDDDALQADRQAQETVERLRRLKAATLPESKPPESFRARLRPYQRQGVDWLQFLREWRLGGILADDMGLGKTVQTLAHLCIEKAAGRLDAPALIVSPTSVAANWRNEIAAFAPDLRTLLLHGQRRHRHFDALDEYDVVLTTYPLLTRDFDALQAQRWSWLILDEAHHIKNPRAKVSRHIRRIPARHRLCLTGTPVENHLEELWSQFDFLMPGLLGSQTHFRKYWRNPIEKQGQTRLLDVLQRKLAPLMLRRTKDQVAKELPPKNEIVLRIPLETRQRKLYDSVRLSMEKTVREALERQGLDKSRITVLNALLKLRQACCDPALLKDYGGKTPPPAAKLDALMEMTEELVREGRRILIFSQFAQMLARIEARMRAAGLETIMLTGQTKDRERVIRRFRTGEAPIFLISLKAGGVGINLTEADTVILYDPWWNPAAEDQAIDRAYRIGQTKTVFVYRLIAEQTIEEKILQMQQRKKRLAASVHVVADVDEPAFSLTEEDIRLLFSDMPIDEASSAKA